ncbi:MAG TPA: hypothetical protein VKT27_15665 [Candidatus Binataceae bacterium]|nr:hypothetical protein [Candidatus Binataceae bacterium]
MCDFLEDRDREDLGLDDLRGTLPPERRVSESPIAIACLRLFTFFPDLPDLSLPRFISCIARPTFCEALRPYFRPPCFVGIQITFLFVRDVKMRRNAHACAAAKNARACLMRLTIYINYWGQSFHKSAKV